MRQLLAVGLTSMGVMVTASVAAQEASDVADLLSENIVTTPSKGLEMASHSAATVSVITAEDMHKYGVRSLDEALNYLTHSIVVTDPAHAKEAGARGVLLTGDYNNHILVLLNGHVLNEPWDGSAYVDSGLGVPFELIDHIEVTLGPGSVMYGSEAMLGVINIVTRKASAFRGVSAVTELDLAAPIARSGNPTLSASFGRGTRFGFGYGQELNLMGKPAELVLAAEWRERMRPAFEVGPQLTDDPLTLEPKNFGRRTSRGSWGGWIDHSRMERAPSAFGQLKVGDFALWLRTAEYTRQSAYLDSTVMTSGDFDDPRNQERDRWFNIDAQQRLVLSRESSMTVRGFTDFYGYRWMSASSAQGDCPVELSNGCAQLLRGWSSSYGVEVKNTVDWTRTGAFVTLVGAEIHLRQVESNFRYQNGPMLNRYEMSDFVEALYAEQKVVPTTYLDFNVGARIDHYENFGTALSPRASVGVKPWSGGIWKNIYSTAFRAPTFYELNYRDSTQVQSPNLGPEKVWSLESSFEQRLGAQRLVVGVFFSKWKKLVQYDTLSASERERAIASGSIAPGTEIAYVYENEAVMKNYGVESRLDGQFTTRLTYGASVTAVRSRVDLGDDGGTQPLTVTPRIFGNARIAYELPGGFPTVALASRFEGSRYADRAFDGGFSKVPKAPSRLDLKLTLTNAIASVHGLSYRVSSGYSFAHAGAYVIGPNMYAVDANARAELSPIERLYLFAGLEFAPGR